MLLMFQRNLLPISSGYKSAQLEYAYIRGGDDKSSSRPTSRCHRTESIFSLERGVCSRAKLQVFSCYRGRKEACQAMCAISTTRHELSSSFFFPQGKVPKEIQAILTETLRGHTPSCATVKNWVAQFKHGDFTNCDAPRPGQHKTDHPRDY